MPRHPAASPAGELAFELGRQPPGRLLALRAHAVLDASPPRPDSAPYDPAMEDAALIASAREGDLDAFAELVRRYEHRVRAVLFRLLDDDRDVEEATQDTFVQAWRNLDRFRGDAAVFTWLYRIAVNEALARLRRKQLPLATLEEGERSPLVAGAASDPQHAAESSDLRAFLAARVR